MKQFHQFASLSVLAAFALMAAPLPAFAVDEDDTLRPLIVRPAEKAVTNAQNTVSSIAPPAPLAAVDLQQPAPVDLTVPDNAKLKLPPPPAPNQIDLGQQSRRPVMAPSSRNMFSDFGPPSGSSVSDRVFQLRDEAIALRDAVDRDNAEFTELRGKGAAGAIQYHSTVAAITARLEAGTTRGNPVLLRQWSEAEQSLSEVHYSISKLNMLGSSLSSSSSNAAYLLQAVKAAFELSGALDEDHDQLAMIRDEVAKTTVNIDHLRNEIVDDIRRQNTYLATERNNLQVLAVAINRGELIRNSLAGQTVVVGAEPAYGTLPNTMPDVSGFPSLRDPQSLLPDDIMPAPPPAPIAPVTKSNLKSKTALPLKTSAAEGDASLASTIAEQKSISQDASTLGQLLVLVRFNQPQVDYEPQLYQVVSSALDRKPDSSFTVVAVSPKGGDPASFGSNTESSQRRADSVKASLVQLGLQPSRISMSNIESEAAEVPEVHVYVR